MQQCPTTTTNASARMKDGLLSFCDVENKRLPFCRDNIPRVAWPSSQRAIKSFAPFLVSSLFLSAASAQSISESIFPYFVTQKRSACVRSSEDFNCFRLWFNWKQSVRDKDQQRSSAAREKAGKVFSGIGIGWPLPLLTAFMKLHSGLRKIEPFQSGRRHERGNVYHRDLLLLQPRFLKPHNATRIENRFLRFTFQERENESP